MAEAKVKRKKMSEEEKKDWNELCEYFKKEILGYGDDMKFPKFLALRLKGLQTGNFIVNKNNKLQGNYTFQEILLTCKYSKLDIMIGFRSNSFVDEKHKINYAMSIIESNLNTIKERLKSRERQEKQIEQIEIAEQSKIKYVNKKDKKKKPNKLLEGIE